MIYEPELTINSTLQGALKFKTPYFLYQFKALSNY